MSNDRYYRWCSYLFLPIQLVGLAIAAAMWAGGELSVLDKLGLAVTVGLVSGIGINAAHELGHRVEHLERWLSRIALAQSAYGHFAIEHNRGHHVRVATPVRPILAEVVSQRAGHADVALTMKTYQHVLPGMDEDAANRAAGYMLGRRATPAAAPHP